MSHILQMQRSAIESFKNDAAGLPALDPDTELFLRDGRSLEVLGVSEGYGTCSGIHGMDVLVVRVAPPRADGTRMLKRAPLNCAYSVLLRGPTVDEVKEERGRHLWGDGHAFACVELLRSIGKENRRVTLSCTGKIRLYVVLA